MNKPKNKIITKDKSKKITKEKPYVFVSSRPDCSMQGTSTSGSHISW